MKYYSKKEASKILNISVRTLERYLKSQKKNVAPFVVKNEKGRVSISQTVIDEYDNVAPPVASLSQSKPIEKDTKNILDKQFEKLEKDNERLTNLVAHKDKIIEEKDRIIEDNRQDFKILTSKIVEQNATILLLQQNTINEEPKEEKQETSNDIITKDDNKNSGSNVLTWFLGFLVFFLGLALLLILLE